MKYVLLVCSATIKLIGFSCSYGHSLCLQIEIVSRGSFFCLFYFRITVVHCELSLLAEIIKKWIGTKKVIVLAAQTKMDLLVPVLT